MSDDIEHAFDEKDKRTLDAFKVFHLRMLVVTVVLGLLKVAGVFSYGWSTVFLPLYLPLLLLIIMTVTILVFSILLAWVLVGVFCIMRGY